MDILRDIEAQILFISSGSKISKIGITELFLQMIVNVRGHYTTNGTFNLKDFIFDDCDLYYVLRSTIKMDYGKIVPSNFIYDDDANAGFAIEN